VGRCISIQWPLDKLNYDARVLRYTEETGKHVIVYEHKHDYATEEVNLNDGSRKWSRTSGTSEEPSTETSSHALVGRIVSVDPGVNDSPEEARHKLACVLAVIHPQMQGMRGRVGRLTCAAAKPLLHRVLWIYGLEFDDVDFEYHDYVVMH